MHDKSFRNLTACKNRGMEVLGLIFWSFSRSVASGTPNNVLSEKDQEVRQVRDTQPVCDLCSVRNYCILL